MTMERLKIFLFGVVQDTAILLLRCLVIYWAYLLFLENLLSLQITYFNIVGGYIILALIANGFFQPSISISAYLEKSETEEENM